MVDSEQTIGKWAPRPRHTYLFYTHCWLSRDYRPSFCPPTPTHTVKREHWFFPIPSNTVPPSRPPLPARRRRVHATRLFAHVWRRSLACRRHCTPLLQLKDSPWASPFLHPRFKDVIRFRLWNTTEQLDGVPEIRDEWRDLQKTLFNSGGHIVSVPEEEEDAETEAEDDADANAGACPAKTDDMLHRTGSKSSSEYDRLSVILSDMARFVLCHRFGGVYLDADTILLRDWEELWALGTFLFRTALRNGLEFHPMTVSRYTKDAHLEGLLLRLPDALFDGAWLNTEEYQRDRPPQPYFTAFGDFFDTPEINSAAPQALGFDGFFKGSYPYHFHNFWWKPFDSARNWPDLGPQFLVVERAARRALREGEAQLPITAPATGAAVMIPRICGGRRSAFFTALVT
ncbi:hypothetical protein B0H14DRAFT_3759840 [Mycena olivaceomarginata]|nr:hypothetical protein B0H14DRAFT_3759840 [Mycena olivaceomarginata]